jgi:multidrug efflux pump subunit AcrA (membrane-fusion protein)
MNPIRTSRIAATHAVAAILISMASSCDRVSIIPAAQAQPRMPVGGHTHADGTTHADDHSGEPDERNDHDHAGPTIAIPERVRRNLGIKFVKVKSRPVRTTRRLPGQFELRPEARREYHVMLAGRVELLVTQYQTVAEGDPLFRLDSPQWRTMQNELATALNAMKRSHADVAVAEANLNELEKSIQFLETRLANLAEAQVRQVELEAQLADKRNALPRLKAEGDAVRAEFDAAHTRYGVMLNTAAAFSGIPVSTLDPDECRDDHAHLEGRMPAWREIQILTITAQTAGVVDRMPITNHGWVESGALVLDTVDPRQLRFHADAVQTDINLFWDGQPARVTPPPGGSMDLQDTADGRIQVGFEAHPDHRTIPIFLTTDTPPTWAKAGVTAYLEVFIAGSDHAVPAIPESALLRDGLERVFFLRDPHDPDTAIRIDADLGATDGRWIEIRGGAHVGDEVVLSGAYPLMLATSESGGREAGGHFHADGTFHAGKDGH